MPEDSGAHRPLVLAFHGGSATGEAMRKLTNLDARADREGWAVAYPDAVEGHWNDGRGVTAYPSHRDDVDDVGFVARLVDHLVDSQGVDRSRVYATGFSNGAMFCHRLAMARPDLIAAFAAVSGTIPRPLADPGPASPVPALLVHGTADGIVPYDGGPVGGADESRGEVLSLDEAVACWRAANGCEQDATTETLPHLDDDDPTTVRVSTWPAGPDGAEVVAITVVDGGHTWPGGLQYQPVRAIGPTAGDLKASDTVFAFFSAHPPRSGSGNRH